VNNLNEDRKSTKIKVGLCVKSSLKSSMQRILEFTPDFHFLFLSKLVLGWYIKKLCQGF
jgi:hypothetical protein